MEKDNQGASASGPGSRPSDQAPTGLAPSGFDPSRKSDLDEAYAVVGELLEYFDGYRLATWAPLATVILRERRETIRRFLTHEIDINGSVEPVKLSLHAYRAHQKYPWFCADCGYPEHERLKHPPRDSDTRRMAETGTGSVRSTGSAVPERQSPKGNIHE